MVKNIKMNKQQMTTESGRSMVEMLGTLAIIGVLSIGGIAGYNLGMEKQRANELLEASLQRAYTVSIQVLTERNASLVEFQDNKKAGGEFETAPETEYLGEIGIKITGVNQNVCKALIQSITDSSLLRAVTATGSESDMSESDCQETNNLTLFYNDDMGTTIVEEVENANGCAVSNCMSCTVDSDGTEIQEFLPEGTSCETAGLAGICDGYGQCLPTGGTYCDSVNGCPEGEFCNYGGWGTTPDVCQKINPMTKTIGDVTYYYNSSSDLESWCRPADGDTNCTWGYLSHDGAESWCAGIGKRLLTASEFRENFDILHSFLPFAAWSDAYWVEGGAIIGDRGYDTNRFDGYAQKGGVVCR